MKLKVIHNKTKTKCILETDIAEMKFLIANCTSCDCYLCAFETCCKSRITTGKRNLCMEIANLKEQFLSSLG